MKFLQNVDKKKRDEIYKVVEGTLKSEGWKLIEMYLKENLQRLYSDLQGVKPDGLKELQMKIAIMKNFIDDIYHFAGYEWTWEGYKDIREDIAPRLSDEDRKYNDYLRAIEGGEI